MKQVTRRTCMGCGAQQRIEIVDGVEPPCESCGPTVWMALPRLAPVEKPCPCECHSYEAFSIDEEGVVRMSELAPPCDVCEGTGVVPVMNGGSFDGN